MCIVHRNMFKFTTASKNQLLSESTTLLLSLLLLLLLCDVTPVAGINAANSMLVASLMFGLVCIFRTEKLQGDRQRLK